MYIPRHVYVLGRIMCRVLLVDLLVSITLSCLRTQSTRRDHLLSLEARAVYSKEDSGTGCPLVYLRVSCSYGDEDKVRRR